MSDIKLGDLVMVVRTCCGGTAKESSGRVGTVREIRPTNTGRWRCMYCGSTGIEMKAYAFSSDAPAAPLSWLKKIDPPATGEYDRVPVRKTQPKETVS